MLPRVNSETILFHEHPLTFLEQDGAPSERHGEASTPPRELGNVKDTNFESV